MSTNPDSSPPEATNASTAGAETGRACHTRTTSYKVVSENVLRDSSNAAAHSASNSSTIRR